MKAGDVVVLKSGGPLMTVEQARVGEGFAVQEAVCVWFEELGDGKYGANRQETFNPNSLEVCPEREEEVEALDVTPGGPDICGTPNCFCNSKL